MKKIKKKLLSILILAMIFTSVFMPEAVFAATTTEVSGETNPNDEKTAYLTFDVKAPRGSIVNIEPFDYAGTGVIDSTNNNKGSYGPGEFEDFTEPFFKVDPRTYLDPGNYYYRITQKDQSDVYPNVEYDDSEYIVWVYIDYATDDNGNYLDEDGNIVANMSLAAKRMSIVLQKDNEHDKPLGVEFENCIEDTRTVKRIITYTEYTPTGTQVSRTIEETVTLSRRVRSDSYGNPIDADGNILSLDNPADESKLIYIGENGNPLGYDSSGRPYLTDDMGNPVQDESGNTKYTTKWSVKSVNPASRAKTPITPGADGNAMVTTPLTSPRHKDGEVWKPDKAQVEGWVLNLNNPPPDGYVERIPVIYTPEAKEEEITVTRTITYTEYTPDGKEVSKTVVQTAVLKRRVMVDAQGNPLKDEKGRPIVIGSNGHPIGYDNDGNPILCNEDGTPVVDANGKPVKTTIWTLVPEKSNLGQVKSPEVAGWTPNIALLEAWNLDLNNPESVVVHVVYTPDGTPPQPPIRTGDESNMPLWGGIAGGAALVLILLLLARKRDKKDDKGSEK